MRDHLDTQTNEFLEFGTRSDCIHPRTVVEAFDGLFQSTSKAMVGCVISMDDWESHPVTSIFDCADSVDELEPEACPASVAAEAKRKESLSIDVISQAALAVQGEEE